MRLIHSVFGEIRADAQIGMADRKGGRNVEDKDIKELVLRLLAKIVPEADLSELEPDTRFRDQFEFDSIDCLSLVTNLETELGIEVPELDYPKFGTLNGCIRYLRGR